MKSNNSILFIGPLAIGEEATHGASVKNRHIVKRLRALGYPVATVDTEHWRRNPLIILQLLKAISCKSHSHVIVSASRMSACRIIDFMRRLHVRKNVIYWVIGGRLNEEIESGKIKKSVLDFPDSVIVETSGMKERLENLGIRNMVTVPNFKPYVAPRKVCDENISTVRFLYLGRIDRTKGCHLIFEASRMLQQNGIRNFSITFMGKPARDYDAEFTQSINSDPLSTYYGFLNLYNPANHARLHGFDCLLFPTLWESEGHAGVLIDAFLASIPVIASDINDISGLIDSSTGFIIRPGDASSLYSKMRDIIENRDLLTGMRDACRKKGELYIVDNILTPTLIGRILSGRKDREV